MTPVEAALRGRLGAHTRWATCEDRRAATAPGHKAFMDRFERQVDPDGALPPMERAKRAKNAKAAHFAAMALKRRRKG